MVVGHVCIRVRVYVQPISINVQRYAIVAMASSLVRVAVVVSSFLQLDFLVHYPYSNRHYRNHLMNLNLMMMMMNLNCLNYPMQSQWPLSNLHFRQFQPFPVLSPKNFQQQQHHQRHLINEKSSLIERKKSHARNIPLALLTIFSIILADHEQFYAKQSGSLFCCRNFASQLSYRPN